MAFFGDDDEQNRQAFHQRMESTSNPIEKLRYACLERGASGIKGLGRSFRIMDDDGSKNLSYEELRNGLRDYGLRLDDNTVQELFRELDKDGSGKLSYDEFLVAIRGPINDRRRAVVEKAFAKMDATGDGVITIEDIRQLYDVSQHPKYQSGEWSADQCFRKFLDSFDSPNDKDGKVTTEEFVNYYTGVSASIDSDDYFEKMMIRAWRL
ncbi:hypothetical protein FSP39_001432 [Pinctada imbricata]|uniref:EF-hand domain-containing protein n=1 Tax=Pinctada imbricata TaxID=66713 RepID=A0AA89BS43_PINIB|nr:hypothetical protein FSP39_001432 [Pinctada imbricata]